MTFPAITSLAAGILTILLMGLGFYVSMGRMRYKQSVGHGTSGELEKRMRCHGNLAENAAIVLIPLALIEMSGADPRFVAILATWLVVARIAHPIGLSGKAGPNPLRFFGSASTYAIGFITGAWLIAIAAQRITL